MRPRNKLQCVIFSTISCALIINLCAAAELRPGATKAKGAAASPRPAAHPSSSRHLPTNRHLPSHKETKKKPVERHVAAASGTRSKYYPRHAQAHHVAGTISGSVTGPKGGPVSGALVRLAKPGGRRIKNPHARHTTSTGSGGTFSMHMVKAGRYRVVASRSGAGRGHAGVAIHSAGIHRADIKLGGAKPKKPKRHK